MTPSGRAREFQRNANRACAPRREEHFIQIARREFAKLPGKFDRAHIGVTPRAERKLLHLLRNRLNHFWMAKPDLVHVISMKIEDLPPLVIDQIRTATALQNVQAWRGE